MSQTEKDIAAIQALLADNTGRGISPQDLRDAIASALGGYAGLLLSIGGAPVVKSAVSATPLIVSEYDTVTAQSADENIDGSSASEVTGVVTIGATGIYKIDFFVTFKSSVNNQEVAFEHFQNGSLANHEIRRFIGTGSEIGAASFSGVVSYAAGDTHDVRVSVDAGPADITFQSVGLSLHRVG